MKLRLIFIFIIAAFFILNFFYFTQLSPILEKPKKINNIENEIFQEKKSDNHIKYAEENSNIIVFLKTLEVNKLHNDIINNENPAILVYLYKNFSDLVFVYNIIDKNIFLINISEINDKEKKQKSDIINQIINRENIDIGIFLNENSFKSNFSDIDSIIYNIRRENIKINIYSDEKELLLKGYLVLYEKFKDIFNKNQEIDNKITGDIVFFVNKPLRTLKIFQLINIILFSLLVWLIFERER
ncbi:MAG: hypothetical protein QXM96_01925 [Candidatus Woesearchaeota archaeon]